MIRCLIVDDEPAAREILQNYISRLAELEISGICNDALAARQVLQEQQTDLMFLDINMPVLSGIELLKSLKNPPQVILTTAYSEFALEGYELDALDYLLKPFSFERFLKAIEKVNRSHSAKSGSEFISIKTDGKLFRLHLNDILYVESVGDYVTIHTTEKKITCLQTLKEFFRQLPEHQFCRVHKSYIVGLSKINYLEGNVIKMNGAEIPIGKVFKENFLQKFMQ